jgi:uncharacterized membrane protein YhdT
MFVRIRHEFTYLVSAKKQITMIEVVVFHAHIVAALYAFTRRWQEESVKEGALALGLIGLVFTVGWAVTGGIAKVITPAGGFTPWFTADTVSLLLLVIPEILLFRMFFLSRGKKKIDGRIETAETIQ